MIREIVSSLEESQISTDNILILDPAISSKLDQYTFEIIPPQWNYYPHNYDMWNYCLSWKCNNKFPSITPTLLAPANQDNMSLFLPFTFLHTINTIHVFENNVSFLSYIVHFFLLHIYCND